MKHNIFIKIIFVTGIWEVFNLLLSFVYYQKGIETGYLNLSILLFIFYIFAKSNKLSFHFLRSNKNLAKRMSEIMIAYGCKEAIRFICLLGLSMIVLTLTSVPELSGSDLKPSLSFLALLNVILLTGILTPMIEEFVFRGVIFDLTRTYSRKKAMFFNVFLFAILHGTSLSILNALLVGVATYELREKNNDIISCILLHMVVNLLGILNANGYQTLFVIISIISIIYYLYHFYKWNKQKDTQEASCKRLFIK